MKTYNELQLAKELIRFPSITPIDAGIMKFLAKKLTAIGFKCKILEFKEKGSKPVKNLYARLNKSKPNFNFAGHLDVGVGAECADQGRQHEGQREQRTGKLGDLSGQRENAGADHHTGPHGHGSGQGETARSVVLFHALLPLGLEFDRSQPQRIGDDRNRGQAHRRGGDVAHGAFGQPSILGWIGLLSILVHLSTGFLAAIYLLRTVLLILLCLVNAGCLVSFSLRRFDAEDIVGCHP